jgi:hypothetical protein
VIEIVDVAAFVARAVSSSGHDSITRGSWE